MSDQQGSPFSADDGHAAQRRMNGLLHQIQRTRAIGREERKELFAQLWSACQDATHEAWQRGRRESAGRTLDQVEGLESHLKAILGSAYTASALLDDVLREAGRTPDRARARWHDPISGIVNPLFWVMQETAPGSTSPRAQLRKHVAMALAGLGELSGYRYLSDREEEATR